MAHFLQSLNPPPKIVHLAPPPSPPPSHHAQIIRSSRPRFIRCNLSRRDLAVASASSLSLFLPTFLFCPPRANADDDSNPSDQEANPTAITINGDCGGSQQVTKKAFLDISIDGEPVGRIVVGLYGGVVPLGSSRFASMVSGAAGVSYRRKEFVKIVENYVQHGGVRSYGVDAEIAKSKGGDLAADSLVSEWEAAQRRCPPGSTKNAAGSLGIIVRDPTKPPPKIKLVARGGKLEVDQEEVRTDPNGTEFVISVKDSPELDASALVVGRVLDGMDVVERISQVKTVKENTSSPYFRVAKLIGDKRAVVAERGFNRPYSKVLVTNCGLLME